MGFSLDIKTVVVLSSDLGPGFYAFVGGEYEPGDTFESRLRIEFQEEMGLDPVNIEYLFVAFV